VQRVPRAHFEAVVPQPTEALIENDRMSRVAIAGIPEDEMVLRATAVIDAKRKRYSEYVRAGVVSPDEPYVIAVCGANIAQAVLSDDVPWIIKPLFGLGRPQLTVPLYSEEQPKPGYEHMPIRMTKNRASVDSALFTDGRACEVSAILFTPHHIKNRPEVYDRPEGNDFVTVHNPFASNPLPTGFVPRGREYGPHEGGLALTKDWRMAAAFDAR
jgi:hypothetical protein